VEGDVESRRLEVVEAREEGEVEAAAAEATSGRRRVEVTMERSRRRRLRARIENKGRDKNATTQPTEGHLTIHAHSTHTLTLCHTLPHAFTRTAKQSIT
jgi:hypothetical protein